MTARKLQFAGSLFDGRSSQKHLVDVELTPQEIILKAPGNKPIRWAYPQLRWAADTSPFHIEHCAEGDEGLETLVVDDPDFYRSVLEIAPKSFSSRENESKFNWKLYAVGILVLIFSAYVFIKTVPSFLADQMVEKIPIEWEVTVGQSILKMLPVAQKPDPEVLKVLQDTVDFLKQSLPGNPYDLKVYILPVEQVNALALPGGPIVIFEGLIDKAESPEELAGVLAHEIQHILLRHSTRGILRNLAKSMLVTLFLGDVNSVMEGIVQLAGQLETLGLSWLFRQNRITGFLMAFVWLGPILIGIAGFLLEILPGVPHARTFFYLQPFFLLLGVMGVRETGTWFLTLMKRNSGFHEKGLRIMTGVLAGILFLIAGLNFLQHSYPQRLSRAPLQRVHDFVRKLNPHDLLLVSHKMHVEFYLYGARDTRNRIENIMRDRQLESIYFLDYEKKSVSGIQESDKKVKPILDFPALTGNAGKEGPTLPEEAVEVAGRFGSFTFYRLKQDWLRPLPGWEKAELDQAPLGTRPFIWDLSGIRPLIRFEDSFTVAIENKELSFYQASGLTLNLVEVAGSEKFFSAALLGGRMKEGNIIFDPSWLPNAWILDHPYGSDIFNRHWNPAVFISQGAGRLSVLDVKFPRRLGHGALRNFSSYRIEKPEVKKK